MKTKYYAYPMKHLISMDASGKLDFPASKIAQDELAANPEFDRQTEVLLDLRDADCNLTTVDLYDSRDGRLLMQCTQGDLPRPQLSGRAVS